MSNLASTLKNKAELWGKIKVKDKLGQWGVKDGKIKDIYCDILPYRGSEANTPAGTEYINQTFKIKVRFKSIVSPQLDMFIMYQNRKYKLVSWNPDFNNKEYLDLFCKLILE